MGLTEKRKTLAFVDARAVDGAGNESRCFEPAGGMPVLRRVVELAASVPGVGAVVCTAPDGAQARRLRRISSGAPVHIIKNDSILGTYSSLLKKHGADFLLRLSGDNLLYTKRIAGSVLAESRSAGAHAYFDVFGDVEVAPSVFGRVDAAPARIVHAAAGSDNAQASYNLYRLQAACLRSGLASVRVEPENSALQELYKLNFDENMFSMRTLGIEATNICNLKCVMCPYHGPRRLSNVRRTPGYLDEGLFSSVCGELSALGRRMQLVFCHRGETLLHPHLAAMISEAKGRGLGVHIVTNAVLLDPGHSNELCAAGADSVTVSIDSSDPGRFHKIRGARLETVEANLKGLLRIRDKTGSPLKVQVNFTLRDENRSEAERFHEKWRRIVDAVSFNEERGACGNVLNAALVADGPRTACEIPLTLPIMLFDGTITMCCVDGDAKYLDCGNVRAGGVMAALTSEKTRALYMKKPAAGKGAPCRGCDLWRPPKKIGQEIRAAAEKSAQKRNYSR